MSSNDTADREMIVTRVVNAPRDLVFKVFTDPKHVAPWWGPNGFTTTVYSMDVRPGGAWCYMMHGPDGIDYPNRVEYIEVTKPERLVYNHGANLESLKDDPERFHATVTFDDLGDKTRVTLRLLMSTAEQCANAKKFGAVEGVQQTLARLDQYLATHAAALR